MIIALYLKYSPENSDHTKGRVWFVLSKYLDVQIVKDKEVAVGRVIKRLLTSLLSNVHVHVMT